MGKAVESAGGTDNTKWGELARTTSDAIINSLYGKGSANATPLSCYLLINNVCDNKR